MPSKIVLLDSATFGDVDLSVFESAGSVKIYSVTSEAETKERVEEADIVVTNKAPLNGRILGEGKTGIRLICVAATGVNNIDLDWATERGIAVTNVAGYSTESVVTHTFSMLFYLRNHSRYYNDYTEAGRWCESPIFTHLDRPFSELAGKNWGIIGMGTIGRRVAAAAAAFGCLVSYTSTSGIQREESFPVKSLEELLKTSDIVSIHAPLNERTKNLIHAANLSLMKRNAILLNLGRGGIVNEKDLAAALDEELIGGAGLDVLEKEPQERDNALLHVQNKERLFITPHIAWAGRESRERLAGEIVKNIKAFQKGERRNRVV